MKEKYERTKAELLALQKDTIKERKELEKLRKQNEGYEKIIERQEKEMHELMEQYEKDIRFLTDEFRTKLE